MRYWTLTEIRDKLLVDLDMEEENFVSPDELIGYINEAIDEAEAEIHTIYEDYFLARATLAIVAGTEAYALPDDIYAHKIRRLVYKDGSETYAIPRLRDWHKFEKYSEGLLTTPNVVMGYLLDNSTPGDPKLVFSPAPDKTGNLVTMWYIRNANRLSADDDVCDIPEFVSFVLQYTKVRCYEKEGNPNLEGAVALLEQQRTQMNQTLMAMVPDTDNTVEPDMSHYIDHS